MTDDAASRDTPAPTDETQTVAFSPTPEPRPEWARSAWLDPAAPVEQAQSVATARPVVTGSGAGVPERRGAGMGQVAVAAVLSAVLASGGTVAFLQGSGALSGSPAGTTAPVVAGSGSTVHRRDCSLISHRDDLHPAGPDAPGLTACRLCKPDQLGG